MPGENSQVFIVPWGGAGGPRRRRQPAGRARRGLRRAPAADVGARRPTTRSCSPSAAASASEMRPYGTGKTYPNFIGDEGRDRVGAAFGEHQRERLARGQGPLGRRQRLPRQPQHPAGRWTAARRDLRRLAAAVGLSAAGGHPRADHARPGGRATPPAAASPCRRCSPPRWSRWWRWRRSRGCWWTGSRTCACWWRRRWRRPSPRPRSAFAGADLAAILVLSSLLSAGSAISQPAEAALVPAIAGDERLTEANGLMETARYVGFAAGPVVAAGLTAVAGTRDGADRQRAELPGDRRRRRARCGPAADPEPAARPRRRARRRPGRRAASVGRRRAARSWWARRWRRSRSSRSR